MCRASNRSWAVPLLRDMKKFLSFRTSATRLAWIFVIIQVALIPLHFVGPCEVSGGAGGAGCLLVLGVLAASFVDKKLEAPLWITLAALLLHVMLTH